MRLGCEIFKGEHFKYAILNQVIALLASTNVNKKKYIYNFATYDEWLKQTLLSHITLKLLLHFPFR